MNFVAFLLLEKCVFCRLKKIYNCRNLPKQEIHSTSKCILTVLLNLFIIFYIYCLYNLEEKLPKFVIGRNEVCILFFIIAHLKLSGSICTKS